MMWKMRNLYFSDLISDDSRAQADAQIEKKAIARIGRRTERKTREPNKSYPPGSAHGNGVMFRQAPFLRVERKTQTRKSACPAASQGVSGKQKNLK